MNEGEKTKLNWGAIFAIAGSILSISIGSGFATGQESMQFFTSFGLKGCIGAVIIMTVTYIIANSIVFDDARKLRLTDTHFMWAYYFGNKIGIVLKYFCAIFIFAVYVVMLAGMGSAVHEYTGLPEWIGNVINVVVLILSACIGRSRLSKLLGVIGIMIMIFAIIIGIVGLAATYQDLPAESEKILADDTLNRSCNWWYVSGLLYTTFMLVNLVPFSASLGKELHKKKEAFIAGLIGAGLFGVCMMFMSLCLMGHFDEIGTVNVPTLVVARSIHPVFGFLFAVVLILGIYSTCLSLLYMVGNFIDKESDRSRKFMIGVICATLLATALGRLGSFATLVNLVYPTTGWLGIIVFAALLIKRFVGWKQINPETGEDVRKYDEETPEVPEEAV